MSHFKERTEKNCLNCNTEVLGRYCQHCGQENIEPHESFWHLVTHFAYDLVHFDGKFFSTAKALLLKPGFLAQEHMKGRRMSYLHPIRMYVFVSAVFFILFFSIVKTDDIVNVNDSSDQVTSAKEKLDKLDAEIKGLQIGMNAPGVPQKAKNKMQKAINRKQNQLTDIEKDTASWNQERAEDVIYDEVKAYKTFESYDSAQKKLPSAERAGFIRRKMVAREIEVNHKFKTGNEYGAHIAEIFMHSIPKIVFISVPLFALMLQLLYLRKRKAFYYSDHVVYTLHLVCFLFISLFLLICVNKLADLPYMNWIGYLWIPIFIYQLYYGYMGMKALYGGGWGKTLVKYMLFAFMSFIVVVLVFAIFGILSVFVF